MPTSFQNLIASFGGAILYFLVLGGACFGLWYIRDRQPGNTRYSIAIYAGIGGCALLMFLGMFIFGIL